MKSLIISALALSLLTGCAALNTTQTNVTYSTNGVPQSSVTTKASAFSLFDSNNQVLKYHASQNTTNGQSVYVGGLDQSSSGTNAVAVLQLVTQLVGAASK